MLRAALQLHDGMSSGRIWLQSVVEVAQFALLSAGGDIEIDGRFGRKTVDALKQFQSEQELLPNGILGKATWAPLEAHIQASLGDWFAWVSENLEEFAGDLGWIHRQEGHLGQPYWPGGASGITLDPGYDLGHATPEFLVHYDAVLTPAQRQELESVIGLRGQVARDTLRASTTLAGIRVSKQLAEEVLPVFARTYWDAISSRFPAVRTADTPASVQTVMLSLAYNRGSNNHHLEPLGPLLEAGDWVALADKVGAMQQSHSLAGIRSRRRQEADLIRDELAFLQA